MKRKQHIRNDSTNSLFAPPAVSEPAITKTVRIEFDGGTPCNIPRLGYGNGYGSYQIDGGPIVRLEFHRPMSANVAEITTLTRAIAVVAMEYDPATTKLEIHGDSKIALGRCFPPRKKSNILPRTTDFGNACFELQDGCSLFAAVETFWRGRAASVALFGH